MALGGYHGRALRVDVGTGVVTQIALPDSVLRRFVGGVGLGTWLLSRESPTGVDPFDPAAAIVIALSPLVGTPLTTSAKFAVVAKSPLTDRIGDALSSDRFAIDLKRAGIDALVIVGRAPTLAALVLDGATVRVEAAPKLAGRSSREVEAIITEERGTSFSVLSIGPAGEALVRFATVSTGARHAGRGGLGAVFGSKNLKAVVARGTASTPLADPVRVLAIAKDLSKRSMGPATAKYRELGTVANVLMLNRLGAMPTLNFGAGSFAGAERISGEAFHGDAPSFRRHCASCTIGCEHGFARDDGSTVRLEYEGLFALGPLCGIDDRRAVLDAAALCDALGIDVISAGATVAFAMEAAQRGLLAASEDGDVVPRFGDGASLLATLRAIGHRAPGVGALLAEGSRRAAATLGPAAQRLALHVKGMELPGYDPRALQTLALGYAVGTRGADHNKSGAYEADLSTATDRTRADEGKGALAVRSEDRAALLDSLVLCKFLRGVFSDLEAESAQMLSAVTGWDMTTDELRRVATRVVTAKKLFNVREGWTRAEDTLPTRILEEPLATPDGGEVRLTREGLDVMIGSYYRARGWSEDGAVPDELVASLGLADLVSVPVPST